MEKKTVVYAVGALAALGIGYLLLRPEQAAGGQAPAPGGGPGGPAPGGPAPADPAPGGQTIPTTDLQNDTGPALVAGAAEASLRDAENAELTTRLSERYVVDRSTGKDGRVVLYTDVIPEGLGVSIDKLASNQVAQLSKSQKVLFVESLVAERMIQGAPLPQGIVIYAVPWGDVVTIKEAIDKGLKIFRPMTG